MQKNIEIILCISTWPQRACDYPHGNALHYSQGYPQINGAAKIIDDSCGNNEGMQQKVSNGLEVQFRLSRTLNRITPHFESNHEIIQFES